MSSDGIKPSPALRANSTTDSYIGSLISLTSKSEIRYEGVLYNINPEESSIGLRNVRSFGTEGRKKDGHQIPPGEKVYEYILFRGTDIKDLQVKSSPPNKPAAAVNNDPAIIQSQYTTPATASVSYPSAVNGTSPDMGKHGQQIGLPGPGFPSGVPLYQPGGSLPPWGPSLQPPGPNGNGGIGMPVYWPNYYAAPNALQHMQQPSMLHLPPSLSIPPLHQPIPYANYNSFLHGVPNLAAPSLPASTPDHSTLLGSTYISTAVSSSPSLVSSTCPPPSSSSAVMPVASESAHGMSASRSSNSSLPLSTSSSELNALSQSASNKSSPLNILPIHYEDMSKSAMSLTNSTPSSFTMETPPLVTPDQLMQPVPATSPPQHAQVGNGDANLDQLNASTYSSKPSESVPTKSQPPLLPLPVSLQSRQKPNDPYLYSRRGHRTYERGRRSWQLRQTTKFTEDFDFIAMNEKFKKDEVWGNLGHPTLKEDADTGNNDLQGHLDNGLMKRDVKPVYVKEDFFDTLSCNALENEYENARPKFREQMKLDTETFGEFSLYRGRGGRGFSRGGYSRGSYYYGRGGYGCGGQYERRRGHGL